MARVAWPVVALALAACSSPSPTTAGTASGAIATHTPAGPAPKLVILFVIDQLPAWAFEAKRHAFTAGFDRLLREGEWHRGQHPHGGTMTAPGHALLGSGEPPARSGILANEWWHRDLERVLASVEGPDGTPSAQWLRVPALGDAVAAARRGGKAVSVSLKDRAAILTLGHAGLAIWYDKSRPGWAASQPAPPWLAAHERSHSIAAHLNDVWQPLDAAKLARLSGATDTEKGEIGDKGFGAAFPHELARTKDPADAVYATPLGNQLVLDTALAAIDGEQLGADTVPDLLVVSLSAHDYVGHGWGHESWEAWDMMLRLDQQLADFLAALDKKLGAERWAMILTSDHGASPMPERMSGGRIAFESIKDAANRAAIAELGQGEWIAACKYPSVYLTAKAAATPPKDKAVLLRKIVYALRSFPGMGRVEVTAEVAGRCDTRSGDTLAACLMVDADASGEVFFTPARGWILEAVDDRHATAHGSLNDYDRVVPVIVLPTGRKPHAALPAPDDTLVDMTQISTTLARWLGVTAPLAMPRGR
jgi:hypothetical protein